jgi:UDP-3-O-[3-hydroxymyristoyl] N-acetylglucosamine deacetylase
MKISRWQTTLRDKASFVGKGLHSGRIVLLDVLPAEANSGIRFVRTDRESPRPIRAIAANVSSTTLNTTIGSADHSVSTIEHLMAAFAGAGITNATVRLNAPEVPILDGSARPFLKRFQSIGLRHQSVRQKVFKVVRPFEFRVGDQYIRVSPASQTEFVCTIDFPHPAIGRQSFTFRPGQDQFSEVAQARTFCNYSDVQKMREQGLALGGSLENAIVLAEKGVMNEEGLRSSVEFVQHKLLDLIGDFHLLGASIVGLIEAYKPGHALHASFMKAVLNEGDVLVSQLSSDEHVSREQASSSVDQPVMSFG